jgi:hypothetical protein
MAEQFDVTIIGRAGRLAAAVRRATRLEGGVGRKDKSGSAALAACAAVFRPTAADVGALLRKARRNSRLVGINVAT